LKKGVQVVLTNSTVDAAAQLVGRYVVDNDFTLKTGLASNGTYARGSRWGSRAEFKIEIKSVGDQTHVLLESVLSGGSGGTTYGREKRNRMEVREGLVAYLQSVLTPQAGPPPLLPPGPQPPVSPGPQAQSRVSGTAPYETEVAVPSALPSVPVKSKGMLWRTAAGGGLFVVLGIVVGTIVSVSSTTPGVADPTAVNLGSVIVAIGLAIIGVVVAIWLQAVVRGQRPMGRVAEISLILGALVLLVAAIALPAPSWSGGSFPYLDPILAVYASALLIGGSIRSRIVRIATAVVAVFALGYFGLWLYGLIIPLLGLALVLTMWKASPAFIARLTTVASKLRIRLPNPVSTGVRTVGITALILVVAPGGLIGLGAFTRNIVANYPSQVQLAGIASLGNPLVGATVKVYRLAPKGSSRVLLATTITDKNGLYSPIVPRQPNEALLVETSGGTYVDEITHKTVVAFGNDSLATVYTPSVTYAALTPLSTFATARDTVLVDSGTSASVATDLTFATVAEDYNLESLTDVYPEIADIAPVDQFVPPDLESRELGIDLAGLDQEAKNLGVDDFSLTEAMANDISDGNLDGKDQGTPIAITPTVPLPGDANTSLLQAGIDTFVASPANLTTLLAPKVATQMGALSPSPGGFYAVADGLPFFTDGASAVEQLVSASGGSAPYRCTLTAGGLPTHFTLHGCQIQYDGTRVLGGGDMAITGPFSVQVSDSASPAQTTVLPDLRLTIAIAPPTITVVNPVSCPSPSVAACSERIASASGGLAPYTFWRGGSLPLGMSIQTYDSTAPKGAKASSLGALNGDQGRIAGSLSTAEPSVPAPGSYTVNVCVVDSIGSETCANTTVIIAPEPTPNPTAAPTNTPNDGYTVGPQPTDQPTPQPTTQPPASNLPPGFPTNLPAGIYQIEVCVQNAGCYGGTNVDMSDGDASNLSQAIESVISSEQSQCDGSCSASYSRFNGSSFSVTVTSTNCSFGCTTGSFTLRITKVG
jgi:hypothetical protein